MAEPEKTNLDTAFNYAENATWKESRIRCCVKNIITFQLSNYKIVQTAMSAGPHYQLLLSYACARSALRSAKMRYWGLTVTFKLSNWWLSNKLSTDNWRMPYNRTSIRVSNYRTTTMTKNCSYRANFKK